MKTLLTVRAVNCCFVQTHLRRELSCKFFERSKLISQVNARRIEDDRKDGLSGARVVNHLVSKKYVREEINWPAVSVLRLPLKEKDQPIDRSVVTNNLRSLNMLSKAPPGLWYGLLTKGAADFLYQARTALQLGNLSRQPLQLTR